MLVRVAVLVVGCLVLNVDSSKDVMKNLSLNFAKPLEACKQEIGIADSVMQDLANFWKEGYELKDRQIGCAIMCLSSKLDLLDAEMYLHHGKAMDFAMKHGADEGTAKQLVDLLHGCGQSVTPNPADACETALNIAICFKVEIHKLNWAPDMDLMIGELLAES